MLRALADIPGVVEVPDGPRVFDFVPDLDLC